MMLILGSKIFGYKFATFAFSLSSVTTGWDTFFKANIVCAQHLSKRMYQALPY
tara:strand:+ start:539 stop:697 length:159 start_codon:yes stop_codon:yes gene_type:complete